MDLSLDPKHKGKEEICNLNSAYYLYISKDDLIVLNYIDGWHFDQEKVLNGLCEVEDAIIEEK